MFTEVVYVSYICLAGTCEFFVGRVLDFRLQNVFLFPVSVRKVDTMYDLLLVKTYVCHTVIFDTPILKCAEEFSVYLQPKVTDMSFPFRVVLEVIRSLTLFFWFYFCFIGPFIFISL